MSDYEVTLVNDNSMTSRDNLSTAHKYDYLTIDSVRQETCHRITKYKRKPEADRGLIKARILRSLQGSRRKCGTNLLIALEGLLTTNPPQRPSPAVFGRSMWNFRINTPTKAPALAS